MALVIGANPREEGLKPLGMIRRVREAFPIRQDTHIIAAADGQAIILDLDPSVCSDNFTIIHAAFRRP